MKSHKSASTARPAQRKRPLISQRGYSIIELSIALAILAVIIIGGLLGVQSILRNNRTNDLLKNMPLIAANANKMTASQTSLQVTTFNLADLGVFPSDWIGGIAAARTVTHPHGGRLFYGLNASASGATAASESFVLTLKGIPEQSCPDVVIGLNSLAREINVQASVAGPERTTLVNVGTEVKSATGTVSLTALATNCGTNGAKEILAVIPRG